MRGLGAILAMSVLLSGMSNMGMAQSSSPRRSRPQPQPRTDELSESEIQSRKDATVLTIQMENVKRQTSFPKWKTHQVEGISIVASNEKNANKIYKRALKQHGL